MNELSLFDSLFNNTMDSVFNNYRTVSVPKVDVKETENAYSLDMELPGRTENDVNIELDHNTLTISSKKEETTEKSEGTEKNNNSGKWLIRERRTS